MARERKTSAASVHQRLLHRARTSGEHFENLLTRFALERLLYRLSVSPFADEFMLKGAMLFVLWTDRPYRPTRDLDLLGRGEPDVERIAEVFRAISAVPYPDDALDFDAASVEVTRIREDEKYEGVRVELLANLAKARITIQVDVGFGDVVTPKPVQVTFPTLLDHAAPIVIAYPRETVVAEKFEAMVVLGIGNSRLKDFFDLHVLAQEFTFDGAQLAVAIGATFARRGTPLPNGLPTALTKAFSEDPAKQKQWVAFQRKRGRGAPSPERLAEVIESVAAFLGPVLTGMASPEVFAATWSRGGPWTARPQVDS